MNIAVALRAYDRFGGIGIYSRNIVKHLLKIDKNNHYILVYNNNKHIDTYKNYENVSEICVPSTNAFFWDQWDLRKALKKWSIDLVFNTKFSVPLFTKAKTIMALHGSSWYTNPEFYSKFDILYVHTMMPVYCKKANFLISNSNLTTKDYIKYLNVDESKIATVPLAAGEEFTLIYDPQILDDIKNKYKLPENFILTVTSYEQKRKNFKTLLKAFENTLSKIGIELVVVGKNCDKYIDDFNLRERGLMNYIHFPGWVEQADLPAFYNLAKAYIFPSVYEEFGIPVLEAMACGCPVVASNTGAIPEITNGSAILCAPFDDEGFTKGIIDIVTSQIISEDLRLKGLERVKHYSWFKTANKTLEIFNQFSS